MKNLSDIIKQREDKNPDRRREVIKFFHERIRDREGKLYRASFIGMKLAHLQLDDLYYLKSICLDAENRGNGFGRTFWGSLKPRPDKM